MSTTSPACVDDPKFGTAHVLCVNDCSNSRLTLLQACSPVLAGEVALCPAASRRQRMFQCTVSMAEPRACLPSRRWQ